MEDLISRSFILRGFFFFFTAFVAMYIIGIILLMRVKNKRKTSSFYAAHLFAKEESLTTFSGHMGFLSVVFFIVILFIWCI